MNSPCSVGQLSKVTGQSSSSRAFFLSIDLINPIPAAHFTLKIVPNLLHSLRGARRVHLRPIPRRKNLDLRLYYKILGHNLGNAAVEGHLEAKVGHLEGKKGKM
jgi:hypothetical protein